MACSSAVSLLPSDHNYGIIGISLWPAEGGRKNLGLIYRWFWTIYRHKLKMDRYSVTAPISSVTGKKLRKKILQVLRLQQYICTTRTGSLESTIMDKAVNPQLPLRSNTSVPCSLLLYDDSLHVDCITWVPLPSCFQLVITNKTPAINWIGRGNRIFFSCSLCFTSVSLAITVSLYDHSPHPMAPSPELQLSLGSGNKIS